MATTILTNEFIRNKFNAPEITLADVSVAYTRQLVQPYEQVLQPVDDIERIIEWVKVAFPGEILEYVNAEINKIPVENGILSAQTIKETILSSLIRFIYQYVENLTGVWNSYNDDVSILPWDIRDVIDMNQELSQIFRFDGQENKLPVTFTVQGVPHTHMFSLDFTMGLLTFCKCTNIDFQPQMFGESLGTNNHHYRYLEVFTTKYSVEVVGDPDAYEFNNGDFMQGFATGAIWAGVDHHNYWNNLREYYEGEDENGDEDNEGTPITF